MAGWVHTFQVDEQMMMDTQQMNGEWINDGQTDPWVLDGWAEDACILDEWMVDR